MEPSSLARVLLPTQTLLDWPSLLSPAGSGSDGR